MAGISDIRRAVLKALPKSSIGAEVGAYKGDLSAAILAEVEPQELHLIDPWQYRAEPAYARAMYGGTKGRDQASLDVMYEGVVARFANLSARGVVTIHREQSATCLAGFEDGHFDWIYIDGDHRYEVIKEDLRLAYLKVKPDGLIACDDYGIAGWWDNGVTRAVHEFLPRYSVRVVFVRGTQFVLKKHNA